MRPARKNSERGSALLIVLVMAAMIAILLYKEMPISAFEAQRQREELTVERGSQYKQAIKLFVRKFGRFPGSVAELESTNRMRFLRRKYIDPLTGKDDWRILHAGPGGVILDSKIKNASNGKLGNASTLGAGATFGGFNNSIVQADPDADKDATPSAALRQRQPATVNAGAARADGGSADFPPLPNAGNGQSLYPGLSPNAVERSNASQNGEEQSPGQSPIPSPAMTVALAGMAQQMQAAAGPSSDPNGMPISNAASMNTLANDPSVVAAMAAAGINGIGPGNSAVAQQLNTQNPLQAQGPVPGASAGAATASALSNAGAFPQNGQQPNGQALAGGGIAGVASIAVGKSIKTVNDQTKYSLWEFVFDLRKEQSGNRPGISPVNQQGPGQNGTNAQSGGFSTGSSFGGGIGQNSSSQNGSTSAFGQQQSGTGAPAQGAPSNPPQ